MKIFPGGVEFKLLNTLGPTCIVKKVAPVLKENYVFVRLVKVSFNNLELKRQSRKKIIPFFCENYRIVRSYVSGVSCSVVDADPHGSALTWIRIRIGNADLDPDSGALKLPQLTKVII
jgi:hypothetical protein